MRIGARYASRMVLGMGWAAEDSNRATNEANAIIPMTSRRLVCRERSIARGDGGRFTTPPPSHRKPVAA